MPPFVLKRRGFSPTAFSLTVLGQTFGTPPSGQGQGGGVGATYYDLYGNGWATASVTLPYDGIYTIVVNAQIKTAGTGKALLTVLMDQSPIAVVTTAGAWNQFVTGTAAANYTFGPAQLSAGVHEFEMEINNVGLGFSGELLLNSLTISSSGASPAPAEPAGNRDPTVQPYSSYSMWNTAQGDGGVYGVATDTDVTQLLTLNPAINAQNFSIVLSEAAASDPYRTFNPTADYSMPLASQSLQLPAWVQPALPVNGGDHHITVYTADKTSRPRRMS